ncbi:transposase [Paraburkholderia sp. BL10I2N1]|uniref:RNA-guided endonuclease InsQ/TnpB family protein n=1 Tax=Paraburkholderia sp. BL10I2N1 TaxID=1938796 RepID=UPI0010ECA4DF|nr:transposase [Paraburkholderia sp. BL10I2N1]TDN67125.1 IS605 OrfB family transposase [Paraburkholderia sp. BL10I2N1]
MPKRQPDPRTTTRVLRVRIKDRHASELLDKAFWVNQVWNYSNELSYKVWERERRFISGYEIDRYTSGASKAGVPLHSQTIQAISAEFVTRRVQARKVRLRWRVSSGPRRSLGWVPFKASALRYRNGQIFVSGLDRPLSLWDSYGLSSYELGAGCFSEDARGRWYLNVTVRIRKAAPEQGRSAIGIDLGLKDFAKTSDGEPIEAQCFYRKYEAALGVAQRARQKKRVAAIHARIKNSRKDFLHKASTALVRKHGAIFVGNVNASALARTGMAKSVLDAGWSAFRTMLQYKCDDAGVWFEEVDERYSTQTCSCCGSRTGPSGPEGLAVREWTCTVCDAAHDRDTNAARNILRGGLERMEAQFAAAVGQAVANEVPPGARVGRDPLAEGILALSATAAAAD